ncbi:MAG: SDR family NAD(P)-dependent oxidoreductase [Desulfatibacillum sp.]|nr:SDR family NAD(P)-dependent oxidoreductase [Desulfatibacillum sp.]
MSEKTRKAYEDALNDGFRIERAPAEKAAESKQARVVQAPGMSSQPRVTTSEKADNSAAMDAVDTVIQRLFDLQGQTLSVHEQYLENHSNYTQSFERLMQTQASLITSQGLPDVPENLQRNLDSFHSLHGDTLRMHQKYLDGQTRETESALLLLQGRLGEEGGFSNVLTPVQERIPAPAPVEKLVAPAMARPAPAQAASEPVRQIRRAEPAVAYEAVKQQKPAAIPRVQASKAEAVSASSAQPSDIKELSGFMLQTVSEKTGYPVSMLELSMDMEADLGIDSIKRVEILGAMMDAYPDLPEINPDELADLRTLQQVVDRLEMSMGKVVAPASAPKAGPVPETTPALPAAVVANLQGLSAFMLQTVSEKTGYPASMLELSMDMEAGLGIDSIKRVEILGAMMDAYPDLPEINPDELADLRTLQQVVDRLEKSLDGGKAPAKAAALATVKASPATHRKEPEGKPAPVSGLPDLEKLAQFMLQTVSEKTGYPASMLELSMDMEADLGIDSIKRVEILGAMMDAYPNLPEINPDELADLRTLQQVVDRLGAALQPPKVKPVQVQLAFGAGDAPPVKTEKQGEQAVVPAINTVTNKPVQRSGVRIKPLPPADRLDANFPQGHVCVVTSEGTQMTAELVQSLKKERITPVVVLPPWAGKTGLADVATILLQDTRDASIQYALEKTVSDYGPIGGFIHLSPGSEDLAREGLELAFFFAKHLKSSLMGKDGANAFRRFFLTVARMDGTLGMSGEDYSPIHGGLFGFVKTLDLEWNKVFCRAVDIAPAMEDRAAARAILTEIFDPDVRVKEIGLSSRGRMTLVPEPIHEPLPKIGKIKKEKIQVFLVSGGARGVTARCVAELAREIPSVFVLLGRSPLMDKDPAWADQCLDSAQLKAKAMEYLVLLEEKPTPKMVDSLAREVMTSREIRASLTAIKQAGGTARYINADVTKTKDLKEKLAPALKEFGAFTGIIHGAGVLKDKFIEDKTPEDFNAVFSTKVDGLLAMLSCVNPSDLKYLALFSSAAGFYGNPGQSDYAAANEVLNKFARAFEAIHPACKVVSFNWGPWDGGMVSPELKRMFEQKNVDVIPLDQGARIFVTSLLGGESLHLLVGSSMQEPPVLENMRLATHRVSRKLSLECNPFLPDHVIGDWAVLPTVCVMSWMADSCEQFAPGYHFFKCQDYKLFKGIIFDKTLAAKYVLEARELEKDTEKVDLEVSIFSEKDGKLVPHYKSTVRLLAKSPMTPVYEGVNLSEEQAEDGAVFYKDGTLFHGPNFQMVQKVLNCSKEKLTLKACVPPISAKRQGQFPVGALDPFTADVHFQSQLIWVRKNYEAGSLPARANTVEQYRPIAHGQEFYITLDVLESSETSMKADICAHDALGMVYSRVFGAEVTVSKGLTKLFALAV